MEKIIENDIAFYSHSGLGLHQNKLLELLKIVSDLCFSNNIKFWLDGGSLLGHVRHKSMIPWDDDIDLCFPITDYKKLILLLEQYAKENEKFTLLYKDRGLISWSEYFGFTDHVCEYKWGGIKPIRIDLIPIKEISFEAIKDDEIEVEKISRFFRGDKNFNSIYANYLPALKAKKETILEYNCYMENNSNLADDCFLVKGHGQYSPIKKVKKSIVYPLKEDVFCGVRVLVPYDNKSYLIQSYGDKYMSLPPLEKRKPIAYSAYQLIGADKKINKVIHFDYRRFYYKNRSLSNFKFIFFLVNALGLAHMSKVLLRNMNDFFKRKVGR